MRKTKNDPVNPAHYGTIYGTKLEPLIAEAPYFLGAAVKYIWRCRKKGGAEDVRKARRCLEIHLAASPEVPPGAIEAANRFIRRVEYTHRTLQVTVLVKLLSIGCGIDGGYSLEGLHADLDKLERAFIRGAYDKL